MLEAHTLCARRRAETMVRDTTVHETNGVICPSRGRLGLIGFTVVLVKIYSSRECFEAQCGRDGRKNNILTMVDWVEIKNIILAMVD